MGSIAMAASLTAQLSLLGVTTAAVPCAICAIL
jgi:hypothetical protein